MKINILHLYPDLLNLYGETGNIKALKQYFEFNKIEVNIKNISIEDEIDLNDIDLVYIGMGTENNQVICINHINKYYDKIKNYIESDGFIISTGNSIELFGKYIIDINNEKINTLNIFDYISKQTKSIVNQPLYKCSFMDDYIIGFINKRSEIDYIGNDYLFIEEDKKEGIHYKNFYGTYLIGPLLVRNPKLLEYICKQIIIKKNININLESNLNLEYNAYKEFIKNYYNIIIE